MESKSEERIGGARANHLDIPTVCECENRGECLVGTFSKIKLVEGLNQSQNLIAGLDSKHT